MKSDISGLNDNNNLDPWYWPVHWLRIVYGIWIDQLWYWQYVRPRFKQAIDRRNILISGMLGSLTISIILVFITTFVLSIMGFIANWQLSVIGMLVNTIVIFGVATVLISKTESPLIEKATSLCLTCSVVLCTSYSLVITILFSTTTAKPVILAFVLVAGLSISFGEGVGNGRKANFSGYSILPFVFFFFLIIRFTFFYSLLIVLSYIIGIFLGGIWTIRQITDSDVREQLANPEKSS